MNVLMISPYFAPCTLVGALRMTSLAKYLVSQGVQVTVIKAADAMIGPPDIAAGEPVEGVLYREFIADMNESKSVEAALLQAIDDMCAANHYDCCVASFGPFITASAVTAVQTRYHIPLVVDYRDPWLYHPMPCKTLKEKLLKWYVIVRFHGLEKRLMEYCTAFVSVTPRCVQCMIDHYPALAAKSHCIYNGYTYVPENLAEKRDLVQTNIYILGKLSYYSPEGTKAFFQAVKNLMGKGHPIQVVHIGKEEPLVEEILRDIQFPMENFRAEGQQSYENAIAKARAADIFVAINRDPDGLETKVFDYIYLNKPIVAYGPPKSEFGELISHAENSFMCQTRDEMEAAIERIIVEKLTYLTKDDAFRASLSRAHQNERYYQLLRSISSL